MLGLLCEGLSEPELYGDLDYKLNPKLKERNDFSFQFRKIIQVKDVQDIT